MFDDKAFASCAKHRDRAVLHVMNERPSVVVRLSDCTDREGFKCECGKPAVLYVRELAANRLQEAYEAALIEAAGYGERLPMSAEKLHALSDNLAAWLNSRRRSHEGFATSA